MVAATRRGKFTGLLKWLATLFILMAVLMLSLGPDTPVSTPPDAGQITRMREVASRLRDHAGQSTPQEIALGWSDLNGGAALLGRTIGTDRVAVAEAEEGAEVRASVRLPLGLWANLHANIGSNEDGFPAISGRIGWLPVPAFMVRFGIWMAEQWLLLRGVDAPMPDGVVHQISFGPTGVSARVRLPKDSKLYRTLNAARAAPVDTAQVISRYCALAEMQRTNPSFLLVDQVHRVFDGADDATANKAALVALAMLVVTSDVGTLAGDVRTGIRQCEMGDQAITLLGRQDLAKHWALSAALTAILGADISQAMGTWKEVADSGPGGSGFSFVDLAADRSGVKFGLAASDQAQAADAASALNSATEPQLLPVRALALSEGLTEGEFAARFVDVDSPDYARMVAQIDRVLGEAGRGF